MFKRSVLLLFIVMQGCYVTKTIYTENIFNSWIGKSAQDLTLQQGTPSRIVPDGRDGQVYVYDKSHVMTGTYSAPGHFYSSPVGVAVPGYQAQQLNYQPGATVSDQVVIEKKVEFFVDKAGYIYAWHSTGYPVTYEEKYTKEELERVDQSLFTPPGGRKD